MSGAASAGYYCGGSGVASGMESYYLDAVTDGEPPGAWSGRLAARHGLTGQVQEEDLTRLLGAFEAPDGTRLGSLPRAYRSVADRVRDFQESHPEALPEEVDAARARAEDQTRSAKVAYDLTFSVPKSVSAAHTALWRAELEAERSGDVGRAGEFRSVRLGVEDAIHAANGAALDHVASLTRTRAGAHGRAGAAGRWLPAPDLAVASFVQHTNRSIDPHLHVHNVVYARAGDVEGKVRALDSADLRDQRKAYSAAADRALAEHMTRLGLRMEVRPDGLAREVVGVPQDVIDLFSDRAKAITARMAPLVADAEQRLGRALTPLELARMSRQSGLFTRAAKTHDGETFEEMLDRWQGEMRDEVGAGLVPLAQELLEAHRTHTAAGDEPAAVAGSGFSPSAVIAQAVQACADKHAAWGRAELTLEIDRALPVLDTGDPASSWAVVQGLVDHALSSGGVVQVAGIDDRPAPADLIGDGVTYVRPSAARWAAPVTLDAEDLIRRAAISRGGHHLDPAAVGAWLDAQYPMISPEQRAVVEGLAASDARLVQVIAAAGTGKSFTSGAFAQAWADLSEGGRVQGLTVSEIAAQTLRADGVQVTRNLAAWTAAQDRLMAAGNHDGAARPALPGDEEVRVRPQDVLLVDEASMVGTAQLDRVRAIAEQAGARVVLVGDPRQLAAVESGGALSLLTDGRAETYTLGEVRRFTHDWEAAASLRLRDGDAEALTEYDRHGRIIDTPTLDDAVTEAARRTAADILEGRDAIAVAHSNDLAARVATAVRDQLVAAGHVPADGVHLGLDGSTAAVGDKVMTRHIDRALGVLNRQRWTVTRVTEDGGLHVTTEDGAVRELPAAYVADHVQSAYAATGHAVQGLTVDRCTSVHDGTGDLASLYVPGTRGRDRNTFVVALRPEPGEDAAGPPTTTHSGDGVGDGVAPSGRAVLAGLAAVEADTLAARAQQERDQAWNSSMSTIAGKLEDVTHLATLHRLGTDLDHLTAAGVLDADVRARLAVDPSTDHLARVIRAAEQSGADAYDVLHDAITLRELHSADSVAQVLATRIDRAGHLADVPARTAPARIPAHWQAHHDALHEAARDRTRTLGTATAQTPPAWALTALGPVPEDPVARLDWEAKAGTVAAYRELDAWEHPEQAIRGPGMRTDTEKRALYAEAWDALGRPEGGRDGAGLTDGQLRARVAAWERKQAWAPPHADPALRHAELAADHARTEATLTAAADDHDRARVAAADAAHHEAVARHTETIAAARAAWAEETAWTRGAGEAAADELGRRGLAPGREHDRTTAEEWLAAETAARRADDAHRVVTDHDLTHETDAVAVAETVPGPAAERSAAEAADAGEGSEVDEAPGYAHTSVAPDPSEVELDAYLHAADRAVDITADRASKEAAHDADDHTLTEHDLALDEHAGLELDHGTADEPASFDAATAD